jgi:hypothetical protein
VGHFSSAEYSDVDFSVVVEATTGTNASTAGDIALLDALFVRGAIDAETYVRCYPSDAVSNRDELLEGIRAASESQLAAATQKIADYEAKLTEALELIAKQNAAVENVMSVVNENKDIKIAFAALYKESIDKLSGMTDELRATKAERDEFFGDARVFAEELQKRMGGERGVLPQMQNGTPPPRASGGAGIPMSQPTV